MPAPAGRLVLPLALAVAGGIALLCWAERTPPCTGGIVASVAGERRCLEPGDTFRDHPRGPEMVVVPPGTYRTSSPEDGLDRPEDAPPLHEMSIPRAFAAGRHQLTYAQWDLCAANGACAANKPSDHGWARERKPVIDLTRSEVSGYLDWLSDLTGTRYRLLTEAEWDYAARPGSPRDFGLGFLHGTSWEWVAHCRRPDRPAGADDGICLRRVQKAENWSDTVRYDTSAATLRAFAGFRIARSLDHDLARP